MFSSGQENKINLFEPGTLVFFIMAFIADLFLLGLLGLAIPGVGLAIAMFVLMTHWGVGLVIVFYFWGKSHGWLAKLILSLFWILPLPLMLGLILMVVASNKIGAILIEQAAILAITAATAGAGVVLETGAVAAEGAEVATTVAEGAEAAGAVVEGTGAVAEAGGVTAEAGAQGAEATAETAEGGAGEASAAEDVFKNPYDNPIGTTAENLNEPPEEQFHEGEGAEREKKLKEQEWGEQEEPEQKNKAADRVKKVIDIADRTNRDQDEGEDEGDEDLPLAA
jgi:hypothetical protein